jgi:hypothetical protein
MRENVLYSWPGGKTQREKQSGYVTREKQKKQIQHVLSIELPFLTNECRHDAALGIVGDAEPDIGLVHHLVGVEAPDDVFICPNGCSKSGHRNQQDRYRVVHMNAPPIQRAP